MDDDFELTLDSDQEIEWPDVPRTCFGPGDGRFDADIRWVQSQRNDMYGYVEAYRQAASAMFNSAISPETFMNPNFLMFPLAFIWRHQLELSLKEIIAAGRQIDGQAWDFPPGHRLLPLWQEARPHVVTVGAEDAPELEHVENYIREFELSIPVQTDFGIR